MASPVESNRRRMRGKDKDPAHRGSKDGNDRGARVCDAQKTRERREKNMLGGRSGARPKGICRKHRFSKTFRNNKSKLGRKS